MAPVNNYLNKVLNTLGVQAARNMKSKGRHLVSISELVTGLRALSKSDLTQLKSSVNSLIEKGLVKLVLPETVRRTFAEVGLVNKLGCGVGLVNQLGCGPCGSCAPCGSGCGSGGCCDSCRPRLSVGVVYAGAPVNQMNLNQLGINQLGLNQLGRGPCGSRSAPSGGRCGCTPFAFNS